MAGGFSGITIRFPLERREVIRATYLPKSAGNETIGSSFSDCTRGGAAWRFRLCVKVARNLAQESGAFGMDGIKSYTDSIRQLMPAEVTGAYLAGMQYYSNYQGRLPTETVTEMLYLFILLVLINLAIYIFVRSVRSPLLPGYVTLGFTLWCATVSDRNG